MEILGQYNVVDLGWISLAPLLSGMNKGGFPVGMIATTLPILVWPEQSAATRAAVGFMLPMLCLIDLCAISLYRRHIEWSRLRFLWPGALLGIAVASTLFVSDESALLAISDQALKMCIGVTGLLFVGYFVGQKLILRRLERIRQPGWTIGSLFGFAAGLTSTLAHAAAR